MSKSSFCTYFDRMLFAIENVIVVVQVNVSSHSANKKDKTEAILNQVFN